MNVSYKWLQSYFEEELPEVKKLTEVLTLGAFEIEGVEKRGDDWVIDVDVLPNRNHDCLGHYGIAKEIAVLCGLKIKEGDFKLKEKEVPSTLRVDILDKDLCRRYIGRKIHNIKVAESPTWLTERLETIGQKSINNVVDSANFVMFDTAQPLHAFDDEKVDGGISVRKARKGENITTLDGQEVDLNEDVLVIADDKKPLVIAGIKGGVDAGVTEQTKTIILEAANFEPTNIRKTRTTIGIQTDSSKRFENEISAKLAMDAMEKLTALILEVAGTDETEVEEMVDVYPLKEEKYEINISSEMVNDLLGTALTDDEIEGILKTLDFAIRQDGAGFVVTIPEERLDLRIKEDLIEEIARVYGYDKIEGAPIDFAYKREPNKRLYYMNRIREVLRSVGYSENYGYTFRAKGDIEMKKSLAQGKDFLRTNLTDGMHEVLEFNDRYKDLLAIDRVRMFEFGSVFTDEKEWMSFAVGLGPSKQKGERNALEFLNEKIGTTLSADIFGKQGGVLEINFDELVETLPDVDASEVEEFTSEIIEFKNISPYPFITRDIAVWTAQGTKAEEVLEIIMPETSDLLVQHQLFDVYEKEGKISYAFKLVFQSQEKTLTDEEINTIMEKIAQEMQKKGWEVR